MDSQLILDINTDNCNLDYLNIENSNSFNRICRTCLTERGELRPLFEDRLNEMLMSCAAVQVALNDGLPAHICSQCVLHVSRAYNFKQQVESSDSTLRQYISNFNNTPDSISANILGINYDTNNVAAPVTQNTTQSISTANNKSEYFLINDNSIQSAEYSEEKPMKTETPVDNINSENINLRTKNEKPRETFINQHVERMFVEEKYFVNNDNNVESEDVVEKEENNKLICDICSETFPDSDQLNKHKKIHNKRKEHVCGECGKSFHYKVGLRTHMRTHGIGERKHMCNQCGKRFYEPNELMIHMRRHTGERPVVCETCGKTFADPRSLAKHIKIHTGEKNYQCEICKKRFIHSYTLTAHRRVHTGEKPFICSTCGHTCATSTQLTLHNRTHTLEKPYACSLCPKSFASRSGLSTHQMTHTGERKYICSICGKGARTSTDLASHMRTHTGEKPFECKIPLCTKKYKTHSQLSAHIRTHTETHDILCDSLVDLQNEVDSCHTTLLPYSLSKLTEGDFKEHFRLTKSSVEMLINEIGSAVIPSNPRRPGVHVKTAILLFLWTITHEDSFRTISRRFELGQGHSHRIFIAMCTALAGKEDKFIIWPTGDSITQSLLDFQNLGDWQNFPDVIGAIDNIDIPIPGPANDSSYYNKNGFCSVILQGICNAKMEFINVSADSPGSSTTTWTDSRIYQKLTTNNLLPPNTYIVANSNYDPDNCLLIPFSKDGSEISDEEKIFNDVLENKYSVIKDAFTLLRHNFKRLNFVKIQKIKYAKALIVSACILHNILLNQNEDCDDEKVLCEINDAENKTSDNEFENMNEEEDVMYLIEENDVEAMTLYANMEDSTIFVLEQGDVNSENGESETG